MNRVSVWIAVAAVAALLGGVVIAYRLARVSIPAAPSSSRTAMARGDTAGDVVDRALSQIPARADSEAIKTRWVDDVAELDLSALTPPRREIFMRFANAERCTCGCGYTLATCRINDPTCDSSLPRLEALLDSVRSGRITSAKGVRERPRAAGATRS
jgi:hypothetical protein